MIQLTIKQYVENKNKRHSLAYNAKTGLSLFNGTWVTDQYLDAVLPVDLPIGSATAKAHVNPDKKNLFKHGIKSY